MLNTKSTATQKAWRAAQQCASDIACLKESVLELTDKIEFLTMERDRRATKLKELELRLPELKLVAVKVENDRTAEKLADRAEKLAQLAKLREKINAIQASME